MTAVSDGRPVARLTPLPAEQWTEAERELLSGQLGRADRFLSGAPDAPPLPPILGLLALHPRLGGPWLAFSSALLEAGTLTPAHRELLILRVGWRLGSRYLTSQHTTMAMDAGIPGEQLPAIAGGPRMECWSDRERALLQAVDDVLDQHAVRDATWQELAGHYSEQELLELLFVVGSYTCLAMVLNSVGLEPAATPNATEDA